MPFKSEAQRRLFHAKAERGEISEKKVHEWEHETPKKVKENLPYHVKKSAAQIADEVLSKLAVSTTFTTGMPTEKPIASQITQTQTQSSGPSLGSGQGKMAALPPLTGKALQLHRSVNSAVAGRAASQAAEHAAKSKASLEQVNAVASKAQAAQKARQEASRAAHNTRVQGEAAGARASAGLPGNVRVASAENEVVEAALMKAHESPAGSKMWQGLTGLSDDVLMAGMRLKEKNERARQKHAAEQVASAISMLQKMSEVSKKDVSRFFQRNPNPKDERLHAWAEGKGEEPDDVEAKAYQLATERVGGGAKAPDRVQGGKADGKPASKYDPRELAMGKRVEQEHTSDPQLAEEIAKDHLEEISDYYTRLKRMEDAAPKKEAGLLQEQPMQASFPNMVVPPGAPPQQLPPDIFQLLKAQAMIDQSKMAQINDPGDGPHLPYPSERENSGTQMPMNDIRERQQQQAMLEQMYAEQARAQHVESTYKDKVRRGELVGGLGGLAAGGAAGHFLGAGSKYHFPATVLSAAAGGLLGKGLGRHVGQQQGLDYLQQYSGVPWAVQ